MALAPLQEVQEYQTRQRLLWTEERTAENIYTAAVLLEYKGTDCCHYDFPDDQIIKEYDVRLEDIPLHSTRTSSRTETRTGHYKLVMTFLQAAHVAVRGELLNG